jgi:hypothetical protein
MGCMLDYSIEEFSSNKLEEKEKLMDEISDEIVASIKFCKESGANFSVLKLTGIIEKNLLLKIDEILNYCRSFPNDTVSKKIFPKQLFVEKYNPQRTLSHIIDEFNPPSQLTDSEFEDLNRVFKRLYKIGDECLKHNIPLIIDAEQTYYQSVIDQIHIIMSLKVKKFTYY